MLINNNLILILICYFISSNFILTCELAGYNSGTCVKSSTVVNQINFCNQYLSDNICIPKNRVSKYAEKKYNL